tara:strand:+ start:693 stop:1472 length:780 start_codon:yes stop_codon:yes gene_type:complete
MRITSLGTVFNDMLYHEDDYDDEEINFEHDSQQSNMSLTNDGSLLRILPPTSAHTSKLHLTTWYLFHLSTTIQPFIVLGFWTLVYPADQSCDFRCGTVHGVACILAYFDLVLGRLTYATCVISKDNEKKATSHNKTMLACVLTYPVLWLASQFIWIYTNHKADYAVLQLDDLLSVYLTAGCFSFFVFCFFLNGKLCELRDYRLGNLGLSYYKNSDIKSVGERNLWEMEQDGKTTVGPPAAAYDLSKDDSVFSEGRTVTF